MANFKNKLSEEVRSEIMQLFYRTELRENEIIIDNQDQTIAADLNLSTQAVGSVIAAHLQKKVKELNNRINV